MIRWRTLLRFLGYTVLATAGLQLLPLIMAVVSRDQGLRPILTSVMVTAVFGALCYSISEHPDEELGHREAILLVAGAWLAICAFGALPFYFSSYFSSLTDAVFESVSGFTTTGATVLGSVESLPPSIQFWRCFSHWIGGMGIILLGVAILPLIGVGGIELYRAEFSGARAEKLTPRIAEAAKALWKIYAAFSVLEYAGLRMAGMTPLEAACHTFSTMGTGGFSTRNLSVEAFQNPAVEAVIIVFMLLAGINFTLHYRLFIEGKVRRFLADSELHFYLFLVAATTLAITASLLLSTGSDLPGSARAALFQVSSIMTTTGFSSANFEVWPAFAQLLLVALMFAGGCAGSTSGGLKTTRVMLLMRVVRREFRRLVERRGVFSVRMDGRAVGEPAIQGLLNLVYLAFLVNFSAALVLTACGVDILTSISAVAAAMFNVGPGLAAVGPYDNYGHLPAVAKWTLTFCMLAGRLEFYTVLVLLTPEFWRR